MLQSILENIKSLLRKDIYLPYEVINRINLALPNMPEEQLVELLLVLQDSSSKKEEIMTKLLLKNNNLTFEYTMFLNKEFNKSTNE